MKNTILLLTCSFGLITSASAAIVAQSETFSGGAVPAGYTFSVSGGHVTNDTDAGDGLNDGGIFVDGNNGGPPVSLVSFNFAGTVVAGEQYTFGGNLWQSSSSFGTSDIELLIDGTMVATVASTAPVAGDSFSVNYTALAADAGKTLSFTISSDRPAGGGSSDVGIDNWNLAVVAAPAPAIPEPSSTALLGLGGLALVLRRRR